MLFLKDMIEGFVIHSERSA